MWHTRIGLEGEKLRGGHEIPHNFNAPPNESVDRSVLTAARMALFLLVMLFGTAFPQEERSDSAVVYQYILDRFTRNNSFVGDSTFATIEKLLHATDLDPAPEYRQDPEEIFQDLARENDYAILADIDQDGSDELLLQQVQGSGHFPYFYIYRRDATSHRFRETTYYSEYFTPILFNGQFFFLDKSFDNRNRPRRVVIYRFSKRPDTLRVASLDFAYSYKMPPELRHFIRPEFLDHLPLRFNFHQWDGDTLLQWDNEDSLLIIGDRDTLHFESSEPIWWKLYPDTLIVSERVRGRHAVTLCDVWGLDVAKVENKKYLIAAEYLSPSVTQMSVYSLPDLELQMKSRLLWNVSVR